MYEENTLDHIIYSQADNEANILAASGDLSPDDLAAWREWVSIAPLEPNSALSGKDTEAVGLFDGPDQNFILARARLQEDEDQNPVYHYIFLPRSLVQSMAGNYTRLIELTNQWVATNAQGEPLEPIRVPLSPTSTPDHRLAILEKVLSQYGEGHHPVIFAMLDASLNERRLLIRGFPPDSDARLELVEGLAMFLPASARAELTFSTNTEDVEAARARVIFSDTDTPPTDRHVIDMQEGTQNGEGFHVPYVQCLETLWQGDVKSFVAELRAMEVTANHVLRGESLEEGLTTVAQRHLLDRHVVSDDNVPVEEIVKVLTGEAPPPPGPLRVHYAQRLLEHTLSERDPDTCLVVTRLMDEDDEVDEALCEVLERALETEPDAVYFFVRTRMAQEIDPRWLPLLHSAAVTALEVAIDDGDNETLMSWLNLIAREPAGYELDSVLEQGINAAQKRARQDGAFGDQLLMFSSKRAPDMLDMLLEDEALMDELDAPLGPALREYEPESVISIVDRAPEISLVLLGRAVREAATNEAAAAIFTPEHIDHLWLLYINEIGSQLPTQYQPAHIIQTLVIDGIEWLSVPGLEMLLTRVVSSEDVDLLFQQLSKQLAAEDQLFPLLVTAFQNSAISADRILTLTTQLAKEEILSQQETIDLYLQVAANRDWESGTQPLVEEVARAIQKKHELTVPLNSLWRMLQVASEGQIELVARVVTRHILSHVAALEDEAQLINMLTRLYDRLQWSNSGKAYVANWWREFVQKQPLTRLQQLDRALEGKRELENVRSIVQSAIVIRKMLGKRSLENFAETIATTYTLLQTMSDTFDNRQLTSFDALTVRGELEANATELTPDERSVLSKNLKELAQLIISMAEQRSKASLIRREEEIERQLLSGDQKPQSAIDTMKWLSGYLEGLQNKSDEEE